MAFTFSAHLAARAASIASSHGLDQAATANFIDQFLAGAAEERGRIGAIMALPEAQNRRKAALSVALSDDQLAPDVAARLLASLPVEQVAHIPPLAERMAGAEEIGPGSPPAYGPGAAEQALASAVARINMGR